MAGIDVNDTEALFARGSNTSSASSTTVLDNFTLDAQALELTVRCECGTILVADNNQHLVGLVRLHFDEFHPDLGAKVPADLILEMAEQKEKM
jgi:hypothetical protein